ALSGNDPRLRPVQGQNRVWSARWSGVLSRNLEERWGPGRRRCASRAAPCGTSHPARKNGRRDGPAAARSRLAPLTRLNGEAEEPEGQERTEESPITVSSGRTTR